MLFICALQRHPFSLSIVTSSIHLTFEFWKHEAKKNLEKNGYLIFIVPTYLTIQFIIMSFHGTPEDVFFT